MTPEPSFLKTVQLCPSHVAARWVCKTKLANQEGSQGPTGHSTASGSSKEPREERESSAGRDREELTKMKLVLLSRIITGRALGATTVQIPAQIAAAGDELAMLFLTYSCLWHRALRMVVLAFREKISVINLINA